MARRSFRAVMGVLLVAAVAGATWLAGEKHREDCERDGKVSCSVLPWDSGTTPTRAEREQRAAELLRQACAEAHTACVTATEPSDPFEGSSSFDP
ncbi:MAG: hypothetical protein JHC95_15520 [Solirubrobacteraceae bacterium]|nr:hypothetical protein [Solirubrobacteraceae bacterium]